MKLPPGYVAGVGVHKATAYGGLGQKLMERMGWSKGQGLGKEKHGMKEAIEVKKKEDTSGVGANNAWNWEQKFWEEAYNSAIQNINHETSGSSSSSSSESGASRSSSESDSDSEHGRRGKRARKGLPPQAGALVPTAGAATGAGAAPGVPGSVTVNRDGTIASASAAELRIAAELAKDPWGRWGGRAGKMARIRAQEQEEANRARARLGLPPLPVPAVPTPGQESDSSGSSSSSSDDEAGDRGGGGQDDTACMEPSTSGRETSVADRGELKRRGKTKDKMEKKGSEKDKNDDKKEKKKKDKSTVEGKEVIKDEAAPAKPAPKRLVVVLGGEAAVAARLRMFASFKPTPATGWWGAKMFMSAGLLESLEDEVAGDRRLNEAADRQAAEEAAGRVALGGAAAVAAGQRKGFNEEDQEALYKRAHDFQRVGRRGLGKGEIKVGGTKWEGTKKTFGEDDQGVEADEDGEQATEAPQRVAAAGNGGGGGSASGEEEGEGKRRKKSRKRERKNQDGGDAAVAGQEAAVGQGKKGKKARKQQQQEEEEADTIAGADPSGEDATRKAKRRKSEDGSAGTGTAAKGKSAAALEDQGQQQQQQQEGAAGRPQAEIVGEATAADSEGDGTGATAAPKPKWIKLARMVLKKSAERRVKLRKVVAELLQHAKEQHRLHHHHHKHGKDEKKKAEVVTAAADTDAAAEAAAGVGSPWDHDTVREALERKIRKSNSGLAIDGKFLTMVGA